MRACRVFARHVLRCIGRCCPIRHPTLSQAARQPGAAARAQARSPTAYGAAQQQLLLPQRRSSTLEAARSGSASAGLGLSPRGPGAAARAGSGAAGPLGSYASPAEREQAEAYFSDLLSYRRARRSTPPVRCLCCRARRHGTAAPLCVALRTAGASDRGKLRASPRLPEPHSATGPWRAAWSG